MDPISNVDRIAALLQQKLRERARSSGADRGSRAGRSAERPIGGLDAARAVAAVEGIDDRQRRRAFIQNILTDQFGSALVNDAQFQQLVARVTQAIEEDLDASASLSAILEDLRKT